MAITKGTAVDKNGFWRFNYPADGMIFDLLTYHKKYGILNSEEVIKLKLNARFNVPVYDAREFITYYAEILSFNVSEMLEGGDPLVTLNVLGKYGDYHKETRKLSELQVDHCVRCNSPFSGWGDPLSFCSPCKEEVKFLGRMDAENEARREHIANGGSAWDF